MNYQVLFSLKNNNKIYLWMSSDAVVIGPLRAKLKKRWSGGAMVLGKLPVPGRPTILITVG